MKPVQVRDCNGWTIYNCGSSRIEDETMRQQVEEILDQIRPMLIADGGNIELVDVKDGEVFVHLVGACGCCPASTMTLKLGVERALKEAIPEVKRVVQV
jgi:Fe-S cluster biogenesis protein NfuA